MTNLKEVNFGLNIFCGPAVLSAITGKNTDECAEAIKFVSGRHEIRGVYIHEVEKALKRLGYKTEEVKSVGTSIYANLVSLKEGMYILLIPHHFIAVEVSGNNRYLIDNHTKNPINAAASARLMQKVHKVVKVIPLPPKKFLRREVSILDLPRYGKGHNITIEWHDYYEDPSDNMSGKYGSIYVENLNELESIVREFKKLGEARDE